MKLYLVNGIFLDAEGQEVEVYARKCDKTGVGMNEGFYFVDAMDVIYLDNDEELLLKELAEYGYNNMDDAYDDGVYMYTEWSPAEDCDYSVYLADGIEVYFTSMTEEEFNNNILNQQ